MTVEERKIQGKYTELVVKAGMDNAPTLLVKEDPDAPYYNSQTKEIVIPPETAKNKGLGFIIGHELGHHAFLQSSTVSHLNVIARNKKVNGATTAIFFSSLTLGLGRFFFDRESGLANMHMFFCAAALLQKSLAVSYNYAAEFYSDRFGAKLSSPEEGIETLSEFDNDNQESIDALNSVYRGLQAPKIEAVHEDPRVAAALKRMSGVVEDIASKEREAVGSAIKEVKKSQLKDLLVHPPLKWRVKALQRMADKNPENHTLAGV